MRDTGEFGNYLKTSDKVAVQKGRASNLHRSSPLIAHTAPSIAYPRRPLHCPHRPPSLPIPTGLGVG